MPHCQAGNPIGDKARIGDDGGASASLDGRLECRCELSALGCLASFHRPAVVFMPMMCKGPTMFTRRKLLVMLTVLAMCAVFARLPMPSMSTNFIVLTVITKKADAPTGSRKQRVLGENARPISPCYSVGNVDRH